MRDYQLRGLRWLASMHANGANAEATDADGIYTEPDYLQMVVGSA